MNFLNEIQTEFNPNRFFHRCRERVEKLLRQHIGQLDRFAPALIDAMEYAALSGGKRIRSLIVYAVNYALDGKIEDADAAALAIELMHTYSLIHDDLPVMDNDLMRRGKPTCHVVFGESMALLAGNALQSLAFEVLSSNLSGNSDSQRLAMVSELACASGCEGVMAGQAMDLLLMENIDSVSLVKHIHCYKTGKLILAAARLGIFSVATLQELEVIEAIEQYASYIGLAFQIQDDILDLGELGPDFNQKSVSYEPLKEPISLPMLIGIREAQQQVEDLYLQAFSVLKTISNQAIALQELVKLLSERSY